MTNLSCEPIDYWGIRLKVDEEGEITARYRYNFFSITALGHGCGRYGSGFGARIPVLGGARVFYRGARVFVLGVLIFSAVRALSLNRCPLCHTFPIGSYLAWRRLCSGLFPSCCPYLVPLIIPSSNIFCYFAVGYR